VLSIPSDVNVRANYVLGVVSRSERKDLARSFAAFVLSKEGQNTLTEHGFLPRIP
jgi:ABC-type molybdate transport system substrate-binding protein